MTKDPTEHCCFIYLALPVCQVPFDVDPTGSRYSISAEEVYDLSHLRHEIFAERFIHLLDLRHKILCSSFDAILNGPENNDDLLDESWRSSFVLILEKITGVKIKDPENVLFEERIKSTSQLRQSGIKFERANWQGSWLHITFRNGKIKIPHLAIDNDTESIFRNLIAFEDYKPDHPRRKIVTDYAFFLDGLINTSMDVERLRQCQILTNWLGDDEVVATMFNTLVRDVSFRGNFCYSKVYREVKKYASKRRNTWKGKCDIWWDQLMENYFSSPWSIISFLAAAGLLILSVVQTIFSILQVHKSN